MQRSGVDKTDDTYTSQFKMASAPFSSNMSNFLLSIIQLGRCHRPHLLRYTACTLRRQFAGKAQNFPQCGELMTSGTITSNLSQSCHLQDTNGQSITKSRWHIHNITIFTNVYGIVHPFYCPGISLLQNLLKNIYTEETKFEDMV